MKGFDDKALILFPAYSHYEMKSSTYKYQFKTAVQNLITYLKSVDIEPHVFYVDDIARELAFPEFKYVSTFGTSDKYFISKNVAGCSNALTLPMITFDDIYNEVLAKDPGSSDESVEARFETVLNHSSKAAAKIIPKYKIVVHFLLPNKSQYRVTSKPCDGKIRINVNANTFSPTVYLSGMEENACDLLNVPYANRSLDVWG